MVAHGCIEVMSEKFSCDDDRDSLADWKELDLQTKSLYTIHNTLAKRMIVDLHNHNYEVTQCSLPRNMIIPCMYSG